MVELAIILPIFMLLVFGVIEFGITYNNMITLRQGTREAARQGAVGNFGSTTSCSLTGLTGSPTSDIQKLMCLAKQQVGLNFSNTRVKVLSGSADFTSSGTFQKGEAIIVCVEYPVDAMAKFVTPVLGERVAQDQDVDAHRDVVHVRRDRRSGDRALGEQLELVHCLGGGAVTGRRTLLRVHGDERGVIAVMFALLLVLMLGILALVVDLGNARQQRRVAQASADAAALAGGEAIESGMDRGTGTIPWSTVVTQIKNYAKANDNIPLSAWVGCADTYKLGYRPDSANNNACISATTSSYPAPSISSVGNNVNYLRVHLPASTVKSYFAKAIGNQELVVGASSTAKVIYTVAASQTTTLAAGGPCALCILNPSGLTLDGQNGDVTITDGNVIVNSTSGTAASLNPNGHVKITTVGGSIGGPGSCSPGSCNNFSGAGFSPAWTQQGCGERPPRQRAAVRQRLRPAPRTTARPRTGTTAAPRLLPGIYDTIKNSHTLSPGIYVITGGITLNGNDLIQGDGVMLYFACSNYPTPCAAGENGAGIKATGNGALRITGIRQSDCTTTASLCPYVGMMDFADRNNTETQTWRGNGTNENGSASGISGTIYMKAGTMDLRGNGYQMASQIVTGYFTMKGNPSTVTISYDQSKNYSETHPITTTTYNGTPDNNGLSG